MNQRAIAFSLFGLTLFGTLAPSFVHVAEWWETMVPASMPWLAWLAAFVIEGSLFAALFGLYVVKAGMKGRRWLVALLLLGAGASVYANLAWSLHNRGIDGGELMVWTDILFGAALLPVYAVVTAHAAPHVWTRCSGPKRKATSRSRVKAPASSAPIKGKSKRKPRKAEALERIKAGEYNKVETQADLARALGVSESSVSRWPVERNGSGWKVKE